MKYNQLVLGILIGVGLIGLIGGAYYFGSRSPQSVEVDNPQITVAPTYINPTASNTPSVVPSAMQTKKGIIEGSLSFPSQGIPSDMEICAQNWISQETICTKNHIENSKYIYGVGYTLEVPEGEYYVYATVSSFDGYKAYYNKYVTCGLKYECQDTTPIIVKVEEGKTVSGIDPHDWYHYQPKM